MNVQIAMNGDRALLEALALHLSEGLAEDVELHSGAAVETEKLAYELRDIASLTGLLISGIKAVQLATAFVRARSSSKTPVLELRTPRGRVQLDLSGKSEEEVLALVKSTYPFLE